MYQQQRRFKPKEKGLVSSTKVFQAPKTEVRGDDTKYELLSSIIPQLKTQNNPPQLQQRCLSYWFNSVWKDSRILSRTGGYNE